MSGQPITITWTVSNHTSQPAIGRWTDAVYLSPDANFHVGDPLIGTVDHGTLFTPTELDQGQSYTASLSARLPVALPGNYHAIVVTNVFDDVFEGPNLSNNTTPSLDPIVVSVTTLQLDQPFSDTIAKGQASLYRIQAPANNTMQVDLTSTATDAANELYVRFEALPSAIQSDASFQGHLVANQSATVPNTAGGFYYILVRGDSEPSSATPIQLLVHMLPFGITNVSPDVGGDSGLVTTTITGARFDPAAVVKLVRPQFAEFEPFSYRVVDATRIIATFNLTGAPHGLYDVEVINPDGQTSILPYRYLVQTAQPIDLTVGLGGPAHLDLGQIGVYGVSVRSTTNVDTPYVELEFGVPHLSNPNTSLIPGPRLLFQTNLAGSPNIAGVPWVDANPILNLNGDLTAPGFTMDLPDQGFGSLTFTADVYPQLRDLLKQDPNFLKKFLPFELDSLAFDFYIQAAATPMTADEYVTEQTSIAEKLRQNVLADVNAPAPLLLAAGDATSWDAAYLRSLQDAGLLRPQDVPPTIEVAPQFTSLVATMTAGVLNGDAGQQIISGGNLTAFFDQVRKWYGSNDSAFGGGAVADFANYDLHLSHPTHFETFTIHVGPDQTQSSAPTDPNLQNFFGLAGSRSDSVHLTGPSGFGDKNFVPASTPLPYMMSFQNPNPSELISQIQIEEQLDPNADVRSFRLSDIQLGNLSIHIPGNPASFTGQFDFTQQAGFLLNVTAGVDVISHIAVWSLQAIDPQTGFPISGVTNGLLPAGATGQVGYTIRTNPAATTGSQLQAAARIVLNSDTPIDTNVVSNTIDAVAPTTTLTVIPAGNGSYSLQWSAQDDALGSGVRDYSVFASVNGGPYSVYLQHTTATTLNFPGVAGSTASFIVLAEDNAGNIEQPPPDIDVQPISPDINLGTLPTAPDQTFTPLPVVTPPPTPPTNPVFIQAQQGVPAQLPPVGTPAFATVLTPLSMAAFVTGIQQSNAGIGPLGMAFTPDGQNVFISGGAGRNVLYEFSRAGGVAATPLATLDVPIYDMVFDAAGELWATTGGGPLVQLDPITGQIVARYGDGIGLGLAAAGNTLYVSTGTGVQTFNISTHRFGSFSDTRVDGLAIAPDGGTASSSLWGTTWPSTGQVVRFDKNGHATAMLNVSDADGLAFGAAGTHLANLLFISREDTLTMVDLTSMQTLDVATGGSRGDFAHVGPDGRLYVTQSDQVDVLFPLLPPHVIASNPVAGATVKPIINSITLTFDSDMIATNGDAHSVTDLTNYQLVDTTTGQTVTLGAATYDAASRTVQLWFESLHPDAYSLTVSNNVGNTLGLTLEQPFVDSFTILVDLASATPTLTTTQLDRSTGTLSFIATLTNTLVSSINAPVRLIFAGLPATGDTLVHADGFTNDGHPYVDLLTTGLLTPNQTTPARTISIADPDGAALNLQPQIVAALAPDQLPVISSTPATTAQVGTAYVYQPLAVDPEGAALSYVLTAAPDAISADAKTGAINWVPTASEPALVNFDLRVYDSRGGFADQRWSVTVAGRSPPPILAAIADQTVNEGDLLEVPVGAFDPAGLPLHYWPDNLPAGAVFDAQDQTLRYRPADHSAGTYQVSIFASDGVNTVSTTFAI